ncbi:hypothetical protein MBLNU457_g1043t1 [Dothideomycetes sp. NU457]
MPPPPHGLASWRVWRTRLERVFDPQPSPTEDDATTEDVATTENDEEELIMCKACQGINLQSLTAEHVIPGMGLCKGYRWHATLDDWRTSWFTGRCHTCKEAWYTAWPSEAAIMKCNSPVSIWLGVDGLNAVCPVDGWDTHKADVGHRVVIAYASHHAKGDEAFRFNVWWKNSMIWYTLEGDLAAVQTSLPVARSLGPTTASASSFAIASKWLQDCLLHDPSVQQKPLSLDLLPLRLLEIGSNSCRVRKTALILRERFSRQDTLQYATLSYCWGKLF